MVKLNWCLLARISTQKRDQTNTFTESLFGPKVNDKLEKLGTVTKLRENRNKLEIIYEREKPILCL